MTRKDYIALAKAITEARAYAEVFAAPSRETVLGAVTDAIADALAADNPRFDRERFYAAAAPSLTASVN